MKWKLPDGVTFLPWTSVFADWRPNGQQQNSYRLTAVAPMRTPPEGQSRARCGWRPPNQIIMIGEDLPDFSEISGFLTHDFKVFDQDAMTVKHAKG